MLILVDVFATSEVTALFSFTSMKPVGEMEKLRGAIRDGLSEKLLDCYTLSVNLVQTDAQRIPGRGEPLFSYTTARHCRAITVVVSRAGQPLTNNNDDWERDRKVVRPIREIFWELFEAPEAPPFIKKLMDEE